MTMRDIMALVESTQTIAYHVTLTRSLKKISAEGLVPRIGPRSKSLGERVPAVYVFPTQDAAEDAMGSWLGDNLPEDAPVALLAVDVTGLKFQQDAAYEMAVLEPIEPSRITVITRDF